MEGLFGSAYTYRAFNELKLENESLKHRVAAQAGKNTEGDKVLSAAVYSRYPFNDKNELVIDKGATDGIAAGMPVLAAPGILLGHVTNVRSRSSVVTTLFDPAWKSSVTIGEGRVRAVLHGANTVRLELIPKEVVIREGDEVRNVSPEYPMGLRVGVVDTVRRDDNNVWQVADVRIAYSIENLDSVSVITNFP